MPWGNFMIPSLLRLQCKCRLTSSKFSAISSSCKTNQHSFMDVKCVWLNWQKVFHMFIPCWMQFCLDLHHSLVDITRRWAYLPSLEFWEIVNLKFQGISASARLSNSSWGYCSNISHVTSLLVHVGIGHVNVCSLLNAISWRNPAQELYLNPNS